MGIGAETRRFRYIFASAAGGTSYRTCLVLANIHSQTLILQGTTNNEPGPATPANTVSMTLPLVSRGGSIHPAARVAVIEFTGNLPPGLVTRRQSICILLPFRFEFYKIGMTGTFRGLPVKLVHKIDGRPDINGQL